MVKAHQVFLVKVLVALVFLLFWLFVAPALSSSLIIGDALWIGILVGFEGMIFFYEIIGLRLSQSVVRTMQVSEWRPKAIKQLKQHHDLVWRDYTFETDVFKSIYGGALWMTSKIDFSRVFWVIDVRAGANNLIVSRKASIQDHLMWTKTKSIQDCARVYLAEPVAPIVSVNQFVSDGVEVSQ